MKKERDDDDDDEDEVTDNRRTNATTTAIYVGQFFSADIPFDIRVPRIEMKRRSRTNASQTVT